MPNELGKKKMANKYGLDTDYTRKNLNRLLDDMDNMRPEEMRAALTKVANDCIKEPCSKCGGRSIHMFDADSDYCTDCNNIISVCE